MKSKSSLRTAGSPQPVVTIVPPSPHSSLLGLGETSDRRAGGGDVNRDAGDRDRTTIISSPSPAAPPHPPPPRGSPSPSPSPSPPPPPPADPAPLPLSPVLEENPHNTSYVMAKTLDPPQPQARRSPSARSLVMPENGANASRTLVESPSAIKAELPSFESTNGTPSFPSRDSDAASFVSNAANGTTKDKKRLWKKSSARKPTGLAGAIAASGMAMAQPTLSAVHQASFSSTMQAQGQQGAGSSSTARKPSINSPPRSPQSSLLSHARGKSSEFSPNSKSKRSPSGRSGAGRASISVQSDNASEYYPDDRPDYYSGLDESSDEDECLETESVLDEMEDMPVTGFAVASNKRNADFHELFPNVPEGDYLIEGTCINLRPTRGCLTIFQTTVAPSSVKF